MSLLASKKDFKSTSAFSVENAYHMLVLSKIVYANTSLTHAHEDWTFTEKVVESAGYEFRKLEADKAIFEANAMACWDDKSLFLIFRGTEPLSWKQWITDAAFLHTDFCIGEAHLGFARTLDLVWDSLVQLLNEVGRGKRLFIAGHSLGGGLSQLAAARLYFERQIKPTAVYTFGSPRALNPVGAKLYNEKLRDVTYRVVNNNDMVTNLPFESFGWSHVGKFAYITANGDLDFNPSSWWHLIDRVWGQLRGMSWDMTFIDPAQDHLAKYYGAKLKALIEEKKSAIKLRLAVPPAARTAEVVVTRAVVTDKPPPTTETHHVNPFLTSKL